MTAYYNDNDPQAAEWLRVLIAHGMVAKGVVDERSILDVQPEELREFTQCHFFAGIGGWSAALRLAGWPDDRPVWTASPPCQPFSVAGENLGAEDPRHLSPKLIELVRAARPAMLLGEQVASAAVFGKITKPTKRGVASAPDWAWLDDLSNGLEAAHYAVGASDIPAAGVDAPHIRQRTFWGAVRLEHTPGDGRQQRGTEPSGWSTAGGCTPSGMADTSAVGCDGRGTVQKVPEPGSQQRSKRLCDVSGMGDGVGAGLERHGRHVDHGGEPGRIETQSLGSARTSGSPVRSHAIDDPWSAADWIHCRDGKWRPVEPGTFPLAHGVPGRVGLLRGYGNAIVPQAAAQFIGAFVKCI